MTAQEKYTGFSLMEIALSNYIRKAVGVVIKLNIPDQLVNGPKTADELAKATDTHEKSLYRVMRVLSGVGIFQALPEKKFELTEKGKLLLHRENSMRAYLLYHTDPRMDLLTNELMYCVKNGKPASDIVYGINRFEYLKINTDLNEIYNEAMTSFSLKKGKAVAEGYDFSGISTLMDVGGGYGELMFSIIEKNPHLKGIIFDQPHVVKGTNERIKKCSMSDCVKAVEGDFFASIPKGADAIIMAHVLHDWDDDNSVKILEKCKEALPVGGRVLLVESLLAPANENFPFLALDLVMLVVEEGCERDQAKFAELYDRAGLKFSRVVPLGPGINVIEGFK